MGLRRIKRDELIETAGYFFRTQGFHGTSVQEIADRLKVNKASLYHHITDKETLLLRAVEAQSEFFKRHIFVLGVDEALSPRLRLSRLAAGLETYFVETEGGCLLANVMLELGEALPQATREVMTAYVEAWVSVFTDLFEAQYPKETAKELAVQAVARYQGALILHRLGNSAVLMRQKEQLLTTFDGLYPQLLFSSPTTQKSGREAEEKAPMMQPGLLPFAPHIEQGAVLKS